MYLSKKKEKENEKALSHYRFIKELVEPLVDDFQMEKKPLRRAYVE